MCRSVSHRLHGFTDRQLRSHNRGGVSARPNSSRACRLTGRHCWAVALPRFTSGRVFEWVLCAYRWRPSQRDACNVLKRRLRSMPFSLVRVVTNLVPSVPSRRYMSAFTYRHFSRRDCSRIDLLCSSSTATFHTAASEQGDCRCGEVLGREAAYYPHPTYCDDEVRLDPGRGCLDWPVGAMTA